MGGSSSKKVDTYVIKLEDDKAPNAIKPKKGTQSPTRQGTESDLNNPAPSMTKAKSSAALDRRKSAPNLNAKMKSTNDMALTSSRKLVTSSTVPWLLKGAKFHNASMKDFEMGRIIGRGFMGTVRIVKQIKSDKFLVFKSVKKEAVTKSRAQRHIQSEKMVLNTLNSSFCVKLFGTLQDKHHLYFALEYAAGGELCNRLDKKKFFEPEVAKFYISEIFVAIEHLQSLGFVYRDLKPENVMLDEEGHCKLVDFGFSCAVDTTTGKLHTLCGTPCYLSPEQLDGKFTNGYTNIVDWWSFGVLLFELRTGFTPFCKTSRDTNYEIFLRILKKHISYPWNFDKKSKDLISALCYADPNKRLCDPESIKKHSFFDVSWDAVQDRRMIPPYVPKFGAPGDASHFKQYHDPQAAAKAAEDAKKGKDNKQTANDSLENELKNEYRNGSGDFMDF